jgi:hypothetical protein
VRRGFIIGSSSTVPGNRSIVEADRQHQRPQITMRFVVRSSAVRRGDRREPAATRWPFRFPVFAVVVMDASAHPSKWAPRSSAGP